MLKHRWLLAVALMAFVSFFGCQEMSVPHQTAVGPVIIPINGQADGAVGGFFVTVSSSGFIKWGEFESTGDFWSDRARVRDRGAVSFVRPDGTRYVASYEQALPYRGSLAAAKDAQTQLWGLIDREGNFVVPPQWEGVAWVENVIPSILAEEPALIGVRQRGLWGFVDRQGDIVVEPQYEMVYPFQSGRARVSIDNDRLAFLDDQGRRAFASTFDRVASFTEGLAAFADPETRLWGYINVDGAQVIAPAWRSAFPFSEGRAVVMNEAGEFGAIDTTGGVVVEPQYRMVMACRGGMMAVMDQQGHWGYIDRSGNEVVAPQFDKADGFCGDYAAVFKEGTHGIIDRRGEWVWRETGHEAPSDVN